MHTTTTTTITIISLHFFPSLFHLMLHAHSRLLSTVQAERRPSAATHRYPCHSPSLFPLSRAPGNVYSSLRPSLSAATSFSLSLPNSASAHASRASLRRRTPGPTAAAAA
ncbi:hypothetical protein BC567DRAFT_229594, partial [Phyllosticta citribraziliensis]